MTEFERAMNKRPDSSGLAANMRGRAHELRKETIRETFGPWEGVEHRLEHVATKDGVDFINDSRATNVNSVWMALESIRTPVVWLAGGWALPGRDPRADALSVVHSQMRDLCELVKQKVKGVYYLDALVPDWFRSIFQPVPVLATANMREAVVSAQVMAEPGDTVLLSPAAASFNWYANLEERGRSFKMEVGRL